MDGLLIPKAHCRPRLWSLGITRKWPGWHKVSEHMGMNLGTSELLPALQMPHGAITEKSEKGGVQSGAQLFVSVSTTPHDREAGSQGLSPWLHFSPRPRPHGYKGAKGSRE